MIGLADRTLDQVAEGIADPGFERETDRWLVLAEDGLPGRLRNDVGKSDRQMIEIEVTSQNRAVAAWPFEQTMQRPREWWYAAAPLTTPRARLLTRS